MEGRGEADCARAYYEDSGRGGEEDGGWAEHWGVLMMKLNLTWWGGRGWYDVLWNSFRRMSLYVNHLIGTLTFLIQGLPISL